MARTTLDLDTSIVDEPRRRGRREGKSMGRVASELLAAALEETDDEPDQPSFSWIGGDLGRPHVDLEDTEATWAVLEDRS